MAKVFRFGPFAFDIESGLLVQGDRSVLLGGRAAALLGLLLESHGRPVLKDALIERGWGGMAVEDSNLTVQIAAIRSVLRDGGDANWIKTLPRRGYRYAGPPVNEADDRGLDHRPVAVISGRPSIAVLPFENRSPSDTPDHFVDGVADDIITGLSRIKWLFVIGKQTSFRYGAEPAGTSALARELGARYVLRGSFQQIGIRLRIVAQLDEAETARTVWAQRFERACADLFALQDEVALAVLAALEPGMRQAEIGRLTRQRPQSLDAYDLVLRSQPDVFSGMPDRSSRALPLLHEALALESDYALAHGYAAMAHHNLFLRGGLREADRFKAVEHARSAIQHGQDDSMALALGAFSLAMEDRDVRGALAAFESAMEVSPSTALSYMLASAIHGWAGDAGRAKDFGRMAIRLSPLDPWRFAAWHGVMLGAFRSADYDEALDVAYRAVASNPGHSISYALLSAALVRCGREAEARTAATRVLDLQPSFSTGAHLAAVNCEARLAQDLTIALSDVGLPP